MIKLNTQQLAHLKKKLETQIEISESLIFEYTLKEDESTVQYHSKTLADAKKALDKLAIIMENTESA